LRRRAQEVSKIELPLCLIYDFDSEVEMLWKERERTKKNFELYVEKERDFEPVH
jgi:hypothetical protein